MVTILGLALSSGLSAGGPEEVCGFLIIFQQISIPLITYSLHVVTGTPPNFSEEPQDTVVFERDAAGNRASLNLTCMASGSPTPTIGWFRNGALLSLNQRIMMNANGTLHIANITENTDATRAGTSYHCTATNKFGTIRSRTANISYACELGEERYDFC